MLEYILNGIAWSLISEGRKIGEIITEDLTFWRVQEIVVELALHRFGEGHEDFRYLKEAVALADTARKGRNVIIHSMWLELGGMRRRPPGLAPQRKETVQDGRDRSHEQDPCRRG